MIRDGALELFCKSSDEKIAAASAERACDNTISVWLPGAKTLECELGLSIKPLICEVYVYQSFPWSAPTLF
jgi:hypothetical protein